MVSNAVKPFSISGNMDVGICCICDICDAEGTKIDHIEHSTLYYCQNKGCDCLGCKEHILSCGYCLGCCAEEHGLGESHMALG